MAYGMVGKVAIMLGDADRVWTGQEFTAEWWKETTGEYSLYGREGDRDDYVAPRQTLAWYELVTNLDSAQDVEVKARHFQAVAKARREMHDAQCAFERLTR